MRREKKSYLIHLDIRLKVINRNLLIIQIHLKSTTRQQKRYFDGTVSGSCHIKHTFLHQRNCVLIQVCHVESLKIRDEFDECVITLYIRLDRSDDRIWTLLHVVVPCLNRWIRKKKSIPAQTLVFVPYQLSRRWRLWSKYWWVLHHIHYDHPLLEYIKNERRRHTFLFFIVVVATGQKLTKNKRGNIAVVGFMNDHRNTFSVVIYTDFLGLPVDVHLQQVHWLVSLLVIRSVDKNLIENLVQTSNLEIEGLPRILYKGDVLVHQLFLCTVVYPHLLCRLFNWTN